MSQALISPIYRRASGSTVYRFTLPGHSPAYRAAKRPGPVIRLDQVALALLNTPTTKD